MAYQMLTRTGLSFWEVTSAMQNSIRKGDYEIAGFCLWELLPQYTPYLRKRLLVISAEDCYGVITKEILNLCEIGTEKSLTDAVNLLCKAKKNRDADYFVCNLMFNDADARGWSKGELARTLHTAIRRKNIIDAGRYSAELFKVNRKEFWKMLNDTAMVFYPDLYDEVKALEAANAKMSKPAEETIFVAKAMVLMWTPKEKDLLGYPAMRFDGVMTPEELPEAKPAEECRKIRGLFPEWAYNWHTSYGKYKLKRDAVHAIENDQKLLTPLVENLFDDCSWNRDINACLLKHNPNGYRLPFDDGKIDPKAKYGGELRN